MQNSHEEFFYGRNALFPIDRKNLENCLQLPFHVYLKDIKGVYRECNEAQAKSFGMAKGDDVIGHIDDDFIPEKQSKLLHANDEKIVKIGMPEIITETCTFSNLAPTKWLSLKMPIRSLTQKAIGVFGVSIPFNDSAPFSMALSLIGGEAPFVEQAPQITPPAAPPLKNISLSKREKECLQCLVRGMTAKEIARTLNLSPRTIEFYVENMKKKFNCFNRAELIAKAYNINYENYE